MNDKFAFLTQEEVNELIGAFEKEMNKEGKLKPDTDKKQPSVNDIFHCALLDAILEDALDFSDVQVKVGTMPKPKLDAFTTSELKAELDRRTKQEEDERYDAIADFKADLFNWTQILKGLGVEVHIEGKPINMANFSTSLKGSVVDYKTPITHPFTNNSMPFGPGVRVGF